MRFAFPSIRSLLAALLLAAIPTLSPAAPGRDGGEAREGPGARKSGEATKPSGAERGAGKEESGVGVAILDFEANTPGNPDLGKQIGEVLTATLGGEPGYRLVERATLTRVLQEQELNLSGVISSQDATRVGKLVGARILVTGKAFALDKQVFITAKLIGTETSLVDGAIVKGPREADTAELIMQLSEKISARLREAGPRLLPEDEAVTDPLPALKARLAGRKLPKLAIHVPEQHVARQPAAGVDPAVETELRHVLAGAGFTIIDGTERELDKAGVDLAITGEAFSEFNARIATNLISCSARVEIKVTNRDTNAMVLADRVTTRGVDLAENLAAKTALQKGGRELAIRLLQHFADTLPEADKPGGGAKGGKAK